MKAIRLYLSRQFPDHIAEMDDGTFRRATFGMPKPVQDRLDVGWVRRGLEAKAWDGYPSIEPALCEDYLLRVLNAEIQKAAT